MTRRPADDSERNPALLALINRIEAAIDTECAAYAAEHGREPDMFLMLADGQDMEMISATDDHNALSDWLETVITDWIEQGLVTVDDDHPLIDPPPALQ